MRLNEITTFSWNYANVICCNALRVVFSFMLGEINVLACMVIGNLSRAIKLKKQTRSFYVPSYTTHAVKYSGL